MLGFGARSQTPANIQRTGECVLNLPSVNEAAAVNRLVEPPAPILFPLTKWRWDIGMKRIASILQG